MPTRHASYASAFGDGRSYSRSRRAQIAEGEGKMPLTRAAAALAIPAKQLKLIADPCEWHHVGRYAAAVDYYDVDAIREFLATEEGQAALRQARRATSLAGRPDEYTAGGTLGYSTLRRVIVYRRRAGAQTGTAFLEDGSEVHRVRTYDIGGHKEYHVTRETFEALHRYWELHRTGQIQQHWFIRTRAAIAFAEEMICAGVAATVAEARRYLDEVARDRRYTVTPQSFARYTAAHAWLHRPRTLAQAA